MSYYHIDGVSGVFATSDGQVHEQSKSWRLVIASILFMLSIVISGAAVKIFTSVEQTRGEAPHVASTAPITTPKDPQQAPVVLAASETPSELQKELEAWTATKSSSWSFYVQSLDNGDILAEQHSTEQFQMASIYKLFLLKPLAKKLPAESWANSNITDRSYLDCVQAMLAVSNNPCAEAIAGNLGWNNVHRQVVATGYKNTTLNNTEKFVTTTNDIGLLLDRLYHGDGYDAKTKSIALEALGKRKSAEAIRKACTGCTVYNKTGDLNGYKHDAAIVERNGKAYIVVIFSSGASWTQLTEAAGIIANKL